MAELSSQGVNNKQIAEQLGMTQTSVSLNIRSPLVQNLIVSLREGRNLVIQQQATELKKLAPQAVDLYKRYIDENNDELAPRDKAKLAGDILKSVGLSGEAKTTTTTQVFITAEELEGIRKRSAESPKFIEAEVSEVPKEQNPGPEASDSEIDPELCSNAVSDGETEELS